MMSVHDIPVMTEVLEMVGVVEDILHLRTTCRSMRHTIDEEVGMRWFWMKMVRRVAHRRKYAYDLDGCYTLRRIGIRRAIRATRNYMPIHTIQESRKLFGECQNDRHLCTKVMDEARQEGQNLYEIWRKYAQCRIRYSQKKKKKRTMNIMK